MTTSEKKPTLVRALLPIGIILLGVTAALAMIKLTVKPADRAGSVAVGQTAPAFELLELGPTGDARGLKPLSALGGKLYLVNFWATWCEACIVEMPSIQKLFDAYREQGLRIAAVDIDDNPSVAAPPTIRKLGLTFPVFADPGGKVGDLLDVHAIPFTAVFGGDLTLLYVEAGERDWFSTESRKMIESWIANKP